MKETSYNKKEEHLILQVNVASKNQIWHSVNECHNFIAITKLVRSNKMIAIRRRTFMIKVLFLIRIPPFFLKIGGRHSH